MHVMLTVEQKRELLVTWSRRQLLRPGYELMARISPARFRITNGLVIMLARLGLQSLSSRSMIGPDNMWAKVSPYLHRPAPVIFQRIDVSAWDAHVGLLEGGAFYSCIDSTLDHSAGGKHWKPEAFPTLNLSVSEFQGQFNEMAVIEWLGIIGGAHSAAGHVPDAATVTLEASPTAVHVGHPSVLKWTSEGAANLEIDNGISTVLPRAKGSVLVVPSQATTYIITATGPAGTPPATAQATVTIKTVPDAPVLRMNLEGHTLNLLWDRPLGTITGYRLEQSFDGELWRILRASLGADELTFTASSSPGITLYFRLIALRRNRRIPTE